MKTKRKSKSICRSRLSHKIRINMREYRSGKRYNSPKQAIAVSYAQILRLFPKCKRSLRKRNPKAY